jgi:hypothetical protein
LNSDEIKSSFSPQEVEDARWFELFNHLCYEVFYKNEYGKKMLALLENKYFRSPVASPAREPSWAYFNEGRNELIRAFTHGIQSHLLGEHAKANAKKNPLPRRARVKPIPNEG